MNQFSILLLTAHNPLNFSGWFDKPHLKILIGEFSGTLLFMLMGCMCSLNNLGEDYSVQNRYGMSYSFSAMVALRFFINISGGHANPAITLVTVLLRVIPCIKFGTYLIGQITGALVGYLLFLIITPKNYLEANCKKDDSIVKFRNVGHPVLLWGTTQKEALLFEFSCTFVLCLAWCSCYDYRNDLCYETCGLRFGLVYCSLCFCGEYITTAHINPARSIAPAIIDNCWKDQWIFWVGPFGGSILAAMVYRFCLFEGSVHVFTT